MTYFIYIYIFLTGIECSTILRHEMMFALKKIFSRIEAALQIMNPVNCFVDIIYFLILLKC